jgi:hypothetical protein
VPSSEAGVAATRDSGEMRAVRLTEGSVGLLDTGSPEV